MSAVIGCKCHQSGIQRRLQMLRIPHGMPRTGAGNRVPLIGCCILDNVMILTINSTEYRRSKDRERLLSHVIRKVPAIKKRQRGSRPAQANHSRSVRRSPVAISREGEMCKAIYHCRLALQRPNPNSSIVICHRSVRRESRWAIWLKHLLVSFDGFNTPRNGFARSQSSRGLKYLV